MRTKDAGKDVHLVLGAGGAKCISYAGALSVLEQRGIRFKTVSACSAGTLIASLVCTGMSADEVLRAVRQDLSKWIGTPVLPPPLHWLGLLKWPFARYKTPGYLAFLESQVKGQPVFGDLTIPLSIMGVDMAANRILLYSSEMHPDMRVSEAIRIATAIPSMYPAQEYSLNNIVVDAVFVTNAPVWIPLSVEDNLPIIVIQPENPVRHQRPRNLFNFVFDSFRSGVISHDFYMQQLPRVKKISIDTSNVSYSDFGISDEAREKLIQAGRAKATEVLDLLVDDLWITDSPPWVLKREHTPYSDAVDHAAEVITRYRRIVPKLDREHIFISYAHKDKQWLKRLKKHMRDDYSACLLQLWDDTRIQAGDNWENEIRTALASSRIAVLMVSSNFLESEYINKKELDYLLSILDREDVRLIWFTLDDCKYHQLRWKNIQAAYDLDKPLADLTDIEQEKALDRICSQIADAFNIDTGRLS